MGPKAKVVVETICPESNAQKKKIHFQGNRIRKKGENEMSTTMSGKEGKKGRSFLKTGMAHVGGRVLGARE